MTGLALTWAHISNFLTERIEDFEHTVQGVERSLIERVETELGISLPSLYVDMLLDIGEHAGPVRPLGPRVSTNFFDLVELLPPRTYPKQAYFKVARHVDPRSEPEEPYLDLARCGEHDGPLVTIDQAGPFHNDHVRDLDTPLSAALARNAFLPTEFLLRTEQCSIFAFPDDEEHSAGLEAQAFALVEAMGYARALPAAPTFSCFCGPDGAATVTFLDPEVLAVEFAGDDPKRIRLRVEQLLDAIPDAELQPGGLTVPEPQP